MKKSLLIVASALSLSAFPQATPSPSWTAENSNFPIVSAGIRYMDAVDPNVVWAVGYNGTVAAANSNMFTRTTNGGTTFTAGVIWPDTNTYFPGSIEGIDANTAFVSSYLRASQDRGNVFKTTNGGATWTNMNAANMFTVAGTSFLDFVAFTTPSVGIALGDPAPANDFEIYRTTDGGATWALVPGANIPNAASGEYGLVNVYTKLANHIWFGTNKNRIYHSADGGQTWSVTATITGTVALTTTGTGIEDIAFRDPNNGLALMYANSGVAYLYNTTDGGATWNNIPVIDPNMGLNDFCAIPGSNAYASAGAGTGNNVISYSTNDGVSWTDWGSINIQYLKIDFVNPTTGWAGSFSDPATASIGGMWKYTGPTLASATPPTAQFTIPPSACSSAVITTTNSSIGSPTPTYSWSASPSVTFSPSSTATNPTITFPGNGTYTITLAATNTASTNVTSQVITITTCSAPSAAFTITPAACIGATVSTANTSTGTPAPTSMWSTTPSAGVTYTPGPNATNPTIAFSTAGTYSVTLLSTNISGTATVTHTLTVNPNPTVSVVSTASVLCSGFSATLTASGATTYTWSTSSNSTAIVVSPVSTTVYQVTGTNAAGCKATKNYTQTVSPCTGVEAIAGSTETFNLYPNPNNGVFTIKGQSDITLHVTNDLGQLVKTVVLSGSNNHEAIVDDLKSGIYFVYGNNNAIIVKQKVIVSK